MQVKKQDPTISEIGETETDEFLRYFNKIGDQGIRSYICDLVSAIAETQRESPADGARRSSRIEQVK